MKVGVISVQGAVPEHLKALKNACNSLGVKCEGIPVRRPSQLDEVDAVIIPGGESTTISKLITKFGLYDKLVKLATVEKRPVMGTCAGGVLLAREDDFESDNHGVKLLGLMEMAVIRNAFGRQRESFEKPVAIEGFDEPFHAVFIRAPIITRVWGKCQPLAVIQELRGQGGDKGLAAVIARQDNLLAVAFHPELTPDTRIHEYFIEMI